MGSSQKNPEAGCLRIFTVAFDRLFEVRLGFLVVNDCPAGARNRRKATVNKRRNMAS